MLGSQLLKDGVPWLPRGVQIVGLVAPDKALSGKYVAAHQNFSAHEFSQAVADGADTVRFQVSQFGLDPDSTSTRRPTCARSRTRSAGPKPRSERDRLGPGRGPGRPGSSRCPLPDTGTERVWTELALMFGNDPGVMFELYNEPGLRGQRDQLAAVAQRRHRDAEQRIAMPGGRGAVAGRRDPLAKARRT